MASKAESAVVIGPGFYYGAKTTSGADGQGSGKNLPPGTASAAGLHWRTTFLSSDTLGFDSEAGQFDIPVLQSIPRNTTKADSEWGSDGAVIDLDRSPETINNNSDSHSTPASAQQSYSAPSGRKDSAPRSESQPDASSVSSVTNPFSTGMLNDNFSSQFFPTPAPVAKPLAAAMATASASAPGSSPQKWDFDDGSTGLGAGLEMSAESWNAMIEEIESWDGQARQ